MLKTKPIPLLLIAGFLLTTPETLAQFSDVEKDSLTYLYRHDYVDGFPDGTFKPSQEIARVELIKLILDASQIELLPEKKCFPDLEAGSWYEPYVCTAKALGVVKGYPDGSFKPEQSVNNAEALKIIAEVQNWELSTGNPPIITKGFKDVEENSWYYDYVNAARQYSYIDQVDLFKPGNPVARGSAAEILFRTILEDKMGVEKSIGDRLDVLKRDFFRIEKAALAKTYADFEAYREEVQPFQTEYNEAQNPILEEPKLLTTDAQGNIYAIMKLYLRGPKEDGWLESEVPSKANLLLLAKFDSSKKLILMDWHNYYSSATTGYQFNLAEAKENEFKVDIYETYAGDSSRKLWRSETFKVNPIR